MKPIGLVLLSSLALVATHSTDLAAQGIPKNTRPLGTPRAGGATGTRIMVANPYTQASADSALSVAIAAGMRNKMVTVAGHDFSIVSDTIMNKALEQFGYPLNAILTPANALILAKQIPGTKGIVTSTLQKPTGTYTIIARFFATLYDGGVVQTVQQQPNEKPDAFGGRVAESFKTAFAAFDDARDCEELKDTKPADAKKAAENAIKTLPDQGLAHLCLAQMDLAADTTKKGREEAIGHLTAATKGDPLSLTAWTLLADASLKNGDSAAVAADFKQMLLVAPSNQKLRETIFKYFLQANQPNAARDVADEGLKSDPGNVDLLDLKSNACLFQSDFTCAIDALGQVYAIDSARADSNFYKKIAVAAAQRPDTAALLLWSTRGLKKYPDNMELMGYAEQGYLLTGKTDSAVAVAKRMLAIDPTAVDPALAAVQALAAAGRVSEATPLMDMISAKGSSQQKEQLAAILANAALPLFQKADYPGATDLARQCVKVADPKGRVIGSCQLIFGLAAFQTAAAMDAETEKTKSCDLAKKEDGLVGEADTALQAAKATRPDAVEKPLAAIPQFKTRTTTMIKAYCK